MENPNAVLGLIGAFLQSLSPEQVEDLLSGRSRIALVKRQVQREVKTLEDPAGVDYDQLREDLSGAPSRESGEEYLESKKLGRSGLLALARSLDIPVRKGDNMKTLKEGIIEATIGYRLRSGAIRGEWPDGGGSGD
ncbi:hypothetical protein [Kitasatospora sp. A2-31]|uniref:hypothetical protein n=1 Tax=Kitasatospora sp. A2-31 TaxID=2916414 RepID=UPI001EEC9F9E|nr:hypothetical protein [Kitasatospora sp. A2-31]MCG6494815.1 hypothetical protein [Kitasatospora sp. A2-31]